MPIYEYKCKKNGHRFEVIQKISDPPLKTCIHCRSKVEKLISASAFVLKGAGFYVNDYKKGDGEKSGKSEKSEKSEKSTKDKGEKADKADKGSSEGSGDKSSSTATTETKPSKDTKGTSSAATTS